MQGSLQFTWVFLGTRHIESTKTSATIGRSEVGGLSKKMKKTTQVKKNAEAAVRRNPIARFFGRKSFKRRVGRPEITKSQRVSVKNQGNSTSKATLKSKSLKAKTKGKSNTIPGNGTKNNEEDKKKRIK